MTNFQRKLSENLIDDDDPINNVYIYICIWAYIYTSIAHQIKNALRRTSEHITLHVLKH